MAHRRTRPAPSGGLSPQVIATSVIVVIVAAVVTIFFLTGPQPAEPEEEPEVENPFEGLPAEKPPEPRRPEDG